MLTYPEWKEQYVDKTKIKKPDIMTVTKADKAIIPEAKFTKYALNPDKAPDKAKEFNVALEYTLTDSAALIANIRAHLRDFPAIKKKIWALGIGTK